MFVRDLMPSPKKKAQPPTGASATMLVPCNASCDGLTVFCNQFVRYRMRLLKYSGEGLLGSRRGSLLSVR